MRKGNYIDYTILLACLSKMPEPQQNKDECQVKGFIDTAIPEEFEREKRVRILDLSQRGALHEKNPPKTSGDFLISS